MKPIANFGMPAGSWSDDTSMMLCLAESLTQTGYGPQNFDHQLQLYSKWLLEGHNTVAGKTFDAGGTTRGAIIHYKKTGATIAYTVDDMYQGNGSLMRLAPIGMMFWDDPDRAAEEAAASSVTTHANSLCAMSCKILARAIAVAIQGRPKAEVLAAAAIPEYRKELIPIVMGKYVHKSRDEIHSDGWVAATLEAALWAFAKTSTFEDGAILAVNLAHDADTVGAVYGALAGAHYGFGNIPDRWLVDLKNKGLLEERYLALETVIVGA
jgi:ADP-ribosylglycohydrolase